MDMKQLTSLESAEQEEELQLSIHNELNVSNVKMYKFDTMKCADFKISAIAEADKHLTLIF